MKFVDLRKYKFVLEPLYYFYGWSRSPRILSRESVAKALVRAKSLLPRGYNFKIWDGQRSQKTQVAMSKSFKRRLKAMYPELPAKGRNRLISKFARNPRMRITNLDSHRQGGAFDLTIVDNSGNELYMGTNHDDLTPKARLKYYEKKKKLMLLEEEAKKNRRLLSHVMTKAGFKECPLEWWHWGCDK